MPRALTAETPRRLLVFNRPWSRTFVNLEAIASVAAQKRCGAIRGEPRAQTRARILTHERALSHQNRSPALSGVK